MRNILVLIGIIVFVAVLISFVLQFLRNSKQKQFMYLLQNNEFDTLYKKIDSFYTKSIFPEYNREYVRLNALIMQDRKEEIDATFDKLIPMAKDKNAKIDILDKAFGYYVYDENQEKCDQIIKEIEIQIPGIKISYDITGNRPYIEKNPDSILLKNLKEAVEAETKQKAVVKAFTGYTDTAVIAGRLHNTECMSYGPGSLQYAHKPDEFVEIRDIIRCEKVMNHLVMSLCEER